MTVNREFKVTITKKDVVVGALPTQNHLLPPSNLDLYLPPVDVCILFCYKKPPVDSGYITFDSKVNVLKTSLAQALVSYYPFAGEMAQNLAGVLCNNSGVEFTEAFADIELHELDLYNPEESVEGKLVPTMTHGVLAVQATELKCGGIVVGCKFNHRVADACSANMFLVSWAETAQSTPLSTPPSFLHSILSPRHPGHYDASVDNIYMLIPNIPLIDDHSQKEAQISRIYLVSAKQVLQLQSWANEGKSNSDIKRTKFEAFSAFLWKMVVKEDKGNEKGCFRVGVVVDGRTQLDKNQEKLMASHFGNVLSIPFGEISVKELEDMPLNWVANEVHKVIQIASTEEHFLGLIDYVDAHRQKIAIPRIYSQEDEQALVVSSGLRFPVRKIDFGWGKPSFGSYHSTKSGGNVGYAMPMPSASGNGDWIVYITLPKEKIEVLEEYASDVFKPLPSGFIY